MSEIWDRTKAKKSVTHHLGDKKSAAQTAEELKKRANPFGYQYPEYDYGILADGTIVPMRPLTVIGGHTQADYAQYQLGTNWWNRNSIGVVLGIDSTAYPVPDAMIEGLIKLHISLCKSQGMTEQDMFKHSDLSRTACPGNIDWSAIKERVKGGLIMETYQIEVNGRITDEFANSDDAVRRFNLLASIVTPGSKMSIKKKSSGVYTTKDYIVPGPNIMQLQTENTQLKTEVTNLRARLLDIKNRATI